jgi:bacteriorhodopsin
MYDGIWISKSTAGVDLYWTRWIFYAFSCTLLMYQISTILKKGSSEKVNMIYLTAIVMVTGALASISEEMVKLVFFLVSTFVYLLLILEIVKSKEKAIAYIRYYIVFGWSVFPIVFLLSPEGINLIGNEISTAIYLLLDIFTKILFYMQVKLKE